MCDHEKTKAEKRENKKRKEKFASVKHGIGNREASYLDELSKEAKKEIEKRVKIKKNS